IAATTSAARTARAATLGTLAALGRRLGRGRDRGRGRLGRHLAFRLLVGFVSHLKLQSGFTSGIGERLHAPVEDEAAAIEHDLADPGRPRALGDPATDLPPRRDGGAGVAARLLLERRGGSNRAPLAIDDDLGVDVAPGAVHRQARPAAGVDAKRRAHPLTALLEGGDLRHGYFFLPSLRKIYSPRYLMPLPL